VRRLCGRWRTLIWVEDSMKQKSKGIRICCGWILTSVASVSEDNNGKLKRIPLEN
jgi:hypothetical protein